MGHKFWLSVDLSDSVERCYATLENTGKKRLRHRLCALSVGLD
jgi:hypothetical protein